MKYNLIAIPLIITLISAVTGCKTVGKQNPFNLLQQSDVKINSSINYTTKLSNCIMVLPVMTTGKLIPYQKALEEALTRHVSLKFNRVITPSEVTNIADKNMLILKFKKDLQTLRERMNCQSVVRGRLVGPGESNLMFWSGHEVGIEITFPASHSLKPLWQGRHITTRSSGGLPTSPLGAAIDITKAQMLALDDDVEASVISDGVRKIMNHFPKIS